MKDLCRETFLRLFIFYELRTTITVLKQSNIITIKSVNKLKPDWTFLYTCHSILTTFIKKFSSTSDAKSGKDHQEHQEDEVEDEDEEEDDNEEEEEDEGGDELISDHDDDDESKESKNVKKQKTSKWALEIHKIMTWFYSIHSY